MCIADGYVERLNSINDSVKDDEAKLWEKVSQLDKKINKIYHDLEVANFNAAEGYYFSKRLQNLLQERRLIKNELTNLRVVYDAIKMKDFKNHLNTAKKRLNKKVAYQQKFTSRFSVSINANNT